MRSFFVSVFFASIVSASTVTQTDWSGNSGVIGPVSDWETNFSLSEGISLSNGFLQLREILILPYANCETVTEDFQGFNFVFHGDIDGDGDQDILSASQDKERISWWENLDGNGCNWAENIIDDEYIKALYAFPADVDGDGDLDVMVAAYSTEEDMAWWENVDGEGDSWIVHQISENYFWGRSIRCADIDGDGDLDALTISASPGTVDWWENTDGAGSDWEKHIIDPYSESPQEAIPVDFDGDGDIDVTIAEYGGDDVSWWENIDGVGTSWLRHVVDEDFDAHLSVFAADVDGDGDQDILGGSWGNDGGELALWLNSDGCGTVWTPISIYSGTKLVREVTAADLDSDGDMDVLGPFRFLRT